MFSTVVLTHVLGNVRILSWVACSPRVASGQHYPKSIEPIERPVTGITKQETLRFTDLPKLLLFGWYIKIFRNLVRTHIINELFSISSIHFSG
jgi:hypothetical protein